MMELIYLMIVIFSLVAVAISAVVDIGLRRRLARANNAIEEEQKGRADQAVKYNSRIQDLNAHSKRHVASAVKWKVRFDGQTSHLKIVSDKNEKLTKDNVKLVADCVDLKDKLENLEASLNKKQKAHGKPFTVEIYESTVTTNKLHYRFRARANNGEILGDWYSTKSNAKRGAELVYGDQVVNGVTRWRYDDDKA